jgi:hypothetical protein
MKFQDPNANANASGGFPGWRLFGLWILAFGVFHLSALMPF